MKNLTPSVKAILYTSKPPTAPGKYPVKIRVIFDRKTKYYALGGVYATREAFNDESDPPVINHGKRADNDAIQTQLKRAEAAAKLIADSGRDFTFHLFEKEYQQRVNVRRAAGFIDTLVEELTAEERHSTSSTYGDCKSSLEAYKPGILLNQIDLDFINKYARHLHKRLSPGSVGIHLRTLRAIINTAIKRKAFSKEAYPFKGFTGMPSTKSRSKKALSKDRMKELFAYWNKLSKKDKYSTRWQSLSLFLFSYFVAGINLEDILRLTDKNLKEGNIKFTRAKTKQEIEIPLHETAAQILADYSMVTDYKHLFPYLIVTRNGELNKAKFLEEIPPEKTIRFRKMNLLKKINADLKAIASDLGITPFTFYSARHSFASRFICRRTVRSSYISNANHATKYIRYVRFKES